MQYEKPAIRVVANALRAIQSMKLGGTIDAIDPHNPVKSVSAYDVTD